MKNETISSALKTCSISLINALDIVRNGNCHIVFQNVQLMRAKGMLVRPQYLYPRVPFLQEEKHFFCGNIALSAVGLTVFASIIF